MLYGQIRLVIVAAGLWLGAASAQAQKSFIDDSIASNAVRIEEQLRTEGSRSLAGRSAQQARRDAETALAQNDARRALQPAVSAIAGDPGDWQNWLLFARTALQIAPRDWNERYQLQQRMDAAAYTAYLRAKSRPDEATALALLGEIYAKRELWRPSLNAYSASLKLADNAAVRRTYEATREAHGFRIVDYKVDSDSAAPRVCFRFSEPLDIGKIEFASFVAVSGAVNTGVTTEGSQLCVDGLKHSQRYAVVVRQGLPSSVGETLLKSADYEIYVRDRSPQVRFTGRNYVLPRTGQEGIPIVSVNTAQVDVEVYRIGDRSLVPTVRSEEFMAQLSRYSADQIASEKGSKIWSGTLTSSPQLNQDVITAFPVLDAVGALEPGVYVMIAHPHSGTASGDDQDGSKATQWFVVSDLGLTTFKGNDGVHVFVRSLATAEPIANAQIRLMARNNEVLATKTTDANGYVAFDPGLARGDGGLAPGLVVATVGTDYGFLDLGASAFDLTDRGVQGRPAAGAVDAFLYTERGVYRTGETVYLTALLRNGHGSAIPGVPLTIVVRRPDGVEYRRAILEDQGVGGRALPLPILPGAMRGTWRIAAFTDPKGSSIGEASFLVEDYVPERLEVTLSATAAALHPGQPAEVSVAARYLFGAPGADLEVSGEVTVDVAKSSSIKGLDGFVVGLDDENLEASTAAIEQAAKTDARGQATLQVPIQDVVAPRPVEARLTLRVAEPGGRAVERGITLPILPKGPVIGVRKNFGGDLSEGATATFDVALASPNGERLARKGVLWSLYKVERQYQWYNADGRWGYEPVTSTRRVANGLVDANQSEFGRIAAPVGWGTYRLDVRAPDLGDTAQTSLTFTVGWSGDQTAETPDLLDLSLDKGSYRPGETIRVRLAPRFAGKATLVVVSDKVHEIRMIDVEAGGSEVTLPVTNEWGAGAYVVAMAHRPLDQAARRLPGRALGVAWFSVDREARTLQVGLEAPARMRPRETMRLPIRVSGFTPGDEALITVAAVDVGILNLTRYESPNPVEYLFGQRQLSTEVRDLYGYLIDGMQGTRGAIRTGGDTEPKALEGIPPTQEPLARFSGVIRVGPDGTANVEFDIPQFNGTARIMAVAWTKDRVGGASADVVIRDPVVLTGTLPRFLSVGDRSRLFLQIDNVDGPSGDYTIDVDPYGPVVVAADALRTRVRLEVGGRGTATIPVTAAGPGQATFSVRLLVPGFEAAQTFTLRVEPGSGSLVRRIIRPLPVGGSLTVSQDLVADLIPGTGTVSVSVSPLTGLDVPGLLRDLDRYPYGCSEQIVSRAMPLLYVNRLASLESLDVDSGLEDRIRQSIERILARQDSNGSFGLWSVGGDDLWLDAYVTDFLTRARERNFSVPQLPFNLALDRLRNFVANATDVEENSSEIAYAAYVLARNGRPVMGDLRYLADTKLGSFGSALARGHIAAALALLGDRGRSQTVFGSAVLRLKETRDDGAYRADYGSRLRDGAGLLALISETGSSRESLQPIGQLIDEERSSSRRTSTQENAWMVLAAQALLQDPGGLAVTADGTERKGTFYRTYRDTALSKPVTISNTGTAPAQVVLSVSGNPIAFEPAVSRGYAVERSYYKQDGTPADLQQVRQNDRLVTVLKVVETEAKAARILLVDRLPAGYEIDNPKLVDSGSIARLDWLKADVEPVHAEYRDDRFVAAFERSPDQPATFMVAYMIRAVAPGRYVHPPAQVEDMYRPERFGRTAVGSIEVLSIRP